MRRYAKKVAIIIQVKKQNTAIIRLNTKEILLSQKLNKKMPQTT